MTPVVPLRRASLALLLLPISLMGQPVAPSRPLGALTATAMDAMARREWATALAVWDSAFAIRANNYPLYYAAQAACQVGDTTRSLAYFARARADLLPNVENYRFFADDPLIRCLDTSSTWRSFLSELRTGYADHERRVAAWVAQINDTTQRPDTSASAPARRPPARDRWSLYHLTVPGDTLRVPFLVYVPRAYDPRRATPLYVFLHEAVSRSNFSVSAEVPRYDSVFVRDAVQNGWLILWPLARRSFNWVDHRQALEAVEREISLVRRIFHVDSTRLYIGGNSDGGRGALWFALCRPGLASATFHLASFPSLTRGTECARGDPKRANPMFVMSGGKDGLFPESTVAPLWTSLVADGWPITRDVIPEAEHDVARDAGRMTALVQRLATTRAGRPPS